MSIGLIDAIHSHRRKISSACEEVHSLADACYTIGLTDLGMRLERAVEGLEKSAEEISGQFGLAQTEELRHGEAMMGSLLKLALSGALRTPAERQAAAERGEGIELSEGQP